MALRDLLCSQAPRRWWPFHRWGAWSEPIQGTASYTYPHTQASSQKWVVWAQKRGCQRCGQVEMRDLA